VRTPLTGSDGADSNSETGIAETGPAPGKEVAASPPQLYHLVNACPKCDPIRIPPLANSWNAQQEHVALERHYTVAQVAAAWVSMNTVRRIFASLPGVLKIGSRKPRKRRYVTLSIPERIVKAQYALLTRGNDEH
jgi:hypothetical protein